jgi:serine/threonine protein kinase
VHQSRTARVILALDEDESAPVKEVALKLIRDSEAFHREMEQLHRGELSSMQYAATALKFHPKMRLIDDPECTCCIVFERGARTLADAIVHDAFAGKADDSTSILIARDVLLQLSAGLLHLHETCRAVHCDFKVVNAMQFGRMWKLIDFDATVLIGRPAGLKYSTLVAPPELITTNAGLPIVRDPGSEDKLLAVPSYDVWSFGVVLFHLLVGRPLFLADLDDNLDAKHLKTLLEWDEDECKGQLDCMEWATIRANFGKDLLHWIFQANPSDRPSMAQIRMHPFFTDNPRRNLISCTDLPWNCPHTDMRDKVCPVLCFSASKDDKEAIEFFAGLQSRCPILAECLHMEFGPAGMEQAVQSSTCTVNELPQAVQPRPRVAALCVAVDQFDSLWLPNLSSCCVGARLFAQELKSIPVPFSAFVEVCENPDRAALRNAEAAFCQQLQDASASMEIVVVFVASHGCQLEAELFFAVRDTEVTEAADADEYIPHFRENFVNVNELIHRIRKHWKGPLAVIADTCRSSAYPDLSVATRELSEQIPYTESILCCFSTAARATASDGMEGMPNPFTRALLQCLFKSGAPLRSTILNACTMLGKDEQPSCAIMKFPDVPLIPAFCKIVYVGNVYPDNSQLLLRLRKAMEHHQNSPEAVMVVVTSGKTPDRLQTLRSIEGAGISPWEFEATTGSSCGKQIWSELSIETFAKVVSAWEARSGLSAIALLSARVLQCAFHSLPWMAGLRDAREPMVPDSKEVLLVPVSALKRGSGKMASARRATS